MLRESREKMLRLCTLLCSVTMLAGRADVLFVEDGPVRDAALTCLAFGGGQISKLQAQANKGDADAKAHLSALDRFLKNASDMKRVHECLVQLLLVHMKAKNTPQYEVVPLIPHIELGNPPPSPPVRSPPRKRRVVAPAGGRAARVAANMLAAHAQVESEGVDDDADDFQEAPVRAQAAQV